MSIPLTEIQKILDAFDQEPVWDSIHLSGEGFELHLVARSALGTLGTAAPATNAPRVAPGPVAAAVEVPAAPATASSQAAAPVAGEGAMVESPTMGVFYRAPKPGAPPFVEVGDHVTLESTLCIIEVMKLMTPVKAEVAGRVTSILVADAQQVSRGQGILTILPSPE